MVENREVLLALADRLIDQHDEPWLLGSLGDRINYWRDKCIVASRELRAHAARLTQSTEDHRG